MTRPKVLPCLNLYASNNLDYQIPRIHFDASNLTKYISTKSHATKSASPLISHFTAIFFSYSVSETSKQYHILTQICAIAK